MSKASRLSETWFRRGLSLVILLVLFLFMGRRICLGEIIEGRDDGSGLYAMSAGDGYYVLSGHDYVWPSTVIRVTYSGRTDRIFCITGLFPTS